MIEVALLVVRDSIFQVHSVLTVRQCVFNAQPQLPIVLAVIPSTHQTASSVLTATFSQGIPPVLHVPLGAPSVLLLFFALKAHLATTWYLTRMESTWELSRLATLHVQHAGLTPITA